VRGASDFQCRFRELKLVNQPLFVERSEKPRWKNFLKPCHASQTIIAGDSLSPWLASPGQLGRLAHIQVDWCRRVPKRQDPLALIYVRDSRRKPQVSRKPRSVTPSSKSLVQERTSAAKGKQSQFKKVERRKVVDDPL
jgi:hypothetical protein